MDQKRSEFGMVLSKSDQQNENDGAEKKRTEPQISKR